MHRRRRRLLRAGPRGRRRLYVVLGRDAMLNIARTYERMPDNLEKHLNPEPNARLKA